MLELASKKEDTVSTSCFCVSQSHNSLFLYIARLLAAQSIKADGLVPKKRRKCTLTRTPTPRHAPERTARMQVVNSVGDIVDEERKKKDKAPPHDDVYNNSPFQSSFILAVDSMRLWGRGGFVGSNTSCFPFFSFSFCSRFFFSAFSARVECVSRWLFSVLFSRHLEDILLGFFLPVYYALVCKR